MAELSPDLKVFLQSIRDHPLFPQLIKAIDEPAVPVYRRKQESEIAAEHANWVYESGRLRQHRQWVSLLTGIDQEGI